MKIETTLEKISDALSRIQKVSTKNISLPILETVLLETVGNVLVLRSTNLHIGVEISIPVKVQQEGRCAVKLDILAQIINSLKGEHKISLENKDQTLSIRTEKSFMEVNTFSDTDFPTLPHVEDGVSFTIPVDVVIEGVKSVVYSASYSEIKPEISSVYIYTENNELVFVATDSFRLAEKRMVVPDVSDFPGIIIPIKNVQECVKIFTGIQEKAVLSFNNNQLSLQTDSIYFTSRIIDGNYPDYKRIIPTSFITEVILLKDDITSALRLVNVFSDSFNQIKLRVDKQKEEINLYSRNTDIGENTTAVTAVVNGEDIEIFMNHKYLSDVLSVLGTDSLSVSFSEKNKPCIIKGIGETSFLYLIMPMNR
jgi:DNA polymerase III subunit beta